MVRQLVPLLLASALVLVGCDTTSETPTPAPGGVGVGEPVGPAARPPIDIPSYQQRGLPLSDEIRQYVDGTLCVTASYEAAAGARRGGAQDRLGRLRRRDAHRPVRRATGGRPAQPLRHPWVDCYANGTQVLGPHLCYAEEADPRVPRAPQAFRGWALWSGSSFAAATVTGRIAKAITELGLSATDAACSVLDGADLVPVPGEGDDHDWRPFVRGTASRWGAITVRPPTAGPNS